MKLIILISFISLSVFGQIDSMKVNILYIDGENRANRTIDSINPPMIHLHRANGIILFQ